MRKSFIAIAIGATLTAGLMAGCSNTENAAPNAVSIPVQNPLLQASTLQYQAPDFNLIKDEHFKPALEQGIAEQYQEILLSPIILRPPPLRTPLLRWKKAARY